MLFMEDVGTIQFSQSEMLGLRDYLLKGGFLWVDDFWGSRAWDQWVAELQRVLPGSPIIDIPLTHNTDVADTWEREGENKEYFSLFSPRGYAIGVNVVVYALTH